MIVGKAEINASGSFQISRQYWGNNLYGFRSKIINSPPAAKNSLKSNPLLLIKLPLTEWPLWRIQAIFTLTRACNCKLWTNKLLETARIKLNFVLENVYDKPKLQTTKTVFSSPYGSEIAASEMTIKMSNSNNSQRITVPTMQKQRVASPPSLALVLTKMAKFFNLIHHSFRISVPHHRREDHLAPLLFLSNFLVEEDTIIFLGQVQLLHCQTSNVNVGEALWVITYLLQIVVIPGCIN